MGILATGTFRNNRIGKCPLLSEKELKSQGRGSWDNRVDQNSGIHLVKWFDNKAVTLGSTHAGVTGSIKVKRFDSKKKVYVDVTAPDIVLEYNASMGGVDLADMLISLY
ncbi:piggyBac transposable element-derived protein 2-like [Hydra vulgaris]|uniref:PiggyBac transposable element-derived protein 2-like n=1 Tax=Hydra vulgaris TaxID=6087 RepID=A0ABM4BUY1_HYDVU